MKKTIEELALEERKKYFKEWRAKNKDKVKKHQQTYWENVAKRNLHFMSAKQIVAHKRANLPLKAVVYREVF